AFAGKHVSLFSLKAVADRARQDFCAAMVLPAKPRTAAAVKWVSFVAMRIYAPAKEDNTPNVTREMISTCPAKTTSSRSAASPAGKILILALGMTYLLLRDRTAIPVVALRSVLRAHFGQSLCSVLPAGGVLPVCRFAALIVAAVLHVAK